MIHALMVISPDLLMALISFAGGDLEERRTGLRMVRDPDSRFRAFWSRISRLAGGLTPDESMIWEPESSLNS